MTRDLLFVLAMVVGSGQVVPGISPAREARRRQTSDRDDAMTVERIRSLIPAASSISDADLKALSDLPDPSAIKSQSLSLLLFSLDPFAASEDNPAVADDFKYLTERIPRASTIAEAMTASDRRGYATMLRADYITDCTCRPEGATATGTVSFKADGLYTGRVEYVARRVGDDWQVVEFKLPNYGLKTTRGADGVWKKSKIDVLNK
jgi:hypothetical protein